MNFKRRVCLKLKHHTPGRFQLWKDMEDEIGCMFSVYGLIQSNIIYDSNTKTITIEYDSFEDYSEAVIDAAQQCAAQGLMIEQVSIRDIKTTGSQCNKLINQYKERKKA